MILPIGMLPHVNTPQKKRMRQLMFMEQQVRKDIHVVSASM